MNGERRVRRRVDVSPLVSILRDGVEHGLVVQDTENQIYTGFLQWQHVTDSDCRFEAMNSNRAINDDIVEARLQENLAELAEHGRFKDFGPLGQTFLMLFVGPRVDFRASRQINLLILLNEPSKIFFIMDGQHRCRVMERLHRRTGRDIKFQFRAKAVRDEDEAHQELLHFQNAYPSDVRAFFSSKRSREVATAVLLRLRSHFRQEGLWVSNTTFRVGKRQGDPNRPKLNDFIVFWFLQDSELLASRQSDVEVFERLLKMNQLLRRLSHNRSKLGKSVTEHMVKSAEKFGCFLGFFRPEQLKWKDVEEEAAEVERDAVLCMVCGFGDI